jgi:hypothetical protein
VDAMPAATFESSLAATRRSCFDGPLGKLTLKLYELVSHNHGDFP